MCAFIANMIAILATSLLSCASASVPAHIPVLLPGEAQGVSSGNCQNGWVDASFVDIFLPLLQQHCICHLG